MKYLNFLKKNGIKIILLLIVLLICFLLYNHFNNNPQGIDVSPKELLNIIKPGKYVGNYDIPPTNLYPNGINGKINATFTWNNNSLNFVNNVECFDKKTNEKLFTIVRTGSFYYKPNHGNNLFKICKSVMDGKTVSNHYGWVVGKTNNSLSLINTGTWHIIDKEYNNIDYEITKTNDGMKAVYIHYDGLKMVVDYKLIN
tara:strand:+ start:1048 stop:1644 length:597 start_codon:yes stop_codon:yes gene_type:complete